MRDRRSHRRWLPQGVRTLLALAACLTGYYALPYGRHGSGLGSTPGALVVALTLAVLVVLIIRQVRTQILHGGRQASVESLLLALCLAVIAFSLVYLRLDRQFTGLQTKTDALYFTVTTLATVGYGDIHASGQGARVVVTIQMALDLIYVATMLSVLAGVIGERARARRAASTGAPERPESPAHPGRDGEKPGTPDGGDASRGQPGAR